MACDPCNISVIKLENKVKGPLWTQGQYCDPHCHLQEASYMGLKNTCEPKKISLIVIHLGIYEILGAPQCFYKKNLHDLVHHGV